MKSITLEKIGQMETYSKVVERVLRHARFCSLVVRSTSHLSENGRLFLKTAEPSLAEKLEVNEWPGTKLVEGTASLYRFSVTPSFAALFSASSENLGAWVQPELPEDPAFYRGDGTLIMGSVSHEGDAFLELRDEELELFGDLVSQ
jgi:hypothetical protein